MDFQLTDYTMGKSIYANGKGIKTSNYYGE
jgi:hypothetical protein